ncbi:hypothetical protein SteCoe_1647 [Stentor coeruleus]|uniref:Tetratricopeptide repeat protein n=1 Tax=Stentor coeruleus TaxID=5963 RepID=A0A1R2D1L3_9CILI|nr:hypothetical protein SteCoe_1647 [Stentor coeruleus]
MHILPDSEKSAELYSFLVKFKVIIDDFEQALEINEKCINVRKKLADDYLLSAKISMNLLKIGKAKMNLELAETIVNSNSQPEIVQQPNRTKEKFQVICSMI